jgi:hypothetical protein
MDDYTSHSAAPVSVMERPRILPTPRTTQGSGLPFAGYAITGQAEGSALRTGMTPDVVGANGTDGTRVPARGRPL